MTPDKVFIAYYTMLRLELVRMVRIWSQTFLPPVVTSGLYFVIFGAFIGSQIAPIDGYSYMQFIVPGLIMMQVITSSYANVVSMFFFAKWSNNIDEVLVSPMPNWVVVAGYVSGGVLRGLIVGVMVLLVSLFFTHLAVFNILVLAAALVLTAILFSLAGLLNGVFAKGFDSISIVPTFVLTPLTYLGGIFFSIEQFSPFWQQVAQLNPILYMVNAFRYGFLGITDINLWTCFAVLIGFNVLFVVLLLWLFRKGIGMKE